MVDGCPEVSGFEEVHAVQVRDVHSSLIGRRAVRAVLLHVHAEKAHICPVDVLECKQGFHPVGEGLGHLSAVHKPGQKRGQVSKTADTILTRLGVYGVYNTVLCWFIKRAAGVTVNQSERRLNVFSV